MSDLFDKYLNEIRIATKNDKIYKDECVYSYHTSEIDDGLYVCLKTFVSVSRKFLEVHMRKTQSHLYLNIKTIRKEVESKTDDEPEKKRPTKLALGVEGGFDLNEKQFYFEHTYSIYVFPEDKQISLDSTVNDKLRRAADAIINSESQTYKEELEAQVQSWDGEQRFLSKHSATLKQIPNPPQIPPYGWKCEKCDKKDNLWLNLTDGKILCGRRQLDGSGGNNHAIDHYQVTKHPLAVKLGTITAEGKADVYSYDEDDMVEDVNLAVHLSHFGINVKNMQKTEKTMAELEIDLNQKIGEWDLIQEANSNLKPTYGSGFTGMRNLGNSCYMNSIMQMLFALPDFQHKYFDGHLSYFRNSAYNPFDDFNVQMAKLAYGLLSGVYSKEPTDLNNKLQLPKGIKPHSIKQLIGKGHAEFSTKRQQDAHEFFEYLMTLIDRACHQEAHTVGNIAVNPSDSFKFEVEERLECLQTRHVRYTKRVENCLSLPVDLELALNKAELADYEKYKQETLAKGEKLDPFKLIRPKINLLDCLNLLIKPEMITDFFSSETKKSGNALKSLKFATFPDYLLIQMRKFTHAADWTPIKLDVAIDAPDEINLNEFKDGKGLKENEVELRSDDGAGGASSNVVDDDVRLNEEIISQLVDMGFSLEGSKRAAYNTRDANNVEVAVNWAVSHMEDADFNQKFELPKKQSNKNTAAKSDVKVNEEAVESIISMGFTRPQATKALKETNNNLERAVDWIFSHTDELMDVTENDDTTASASATTSTSNANNKNLRDGNGRYKLIAFVSHMGTNANCGHYVVHILKNNRWYIFNDQNVFESEHAHKELAYLYLYSRV